MPEGSGRQVLEFLDRLVAFGNLRAPILLGRFLGKDRDPKKKKIGKDGETWGESFLESPSIPSVPARCLSESLVTSQNPSVPIDPV